MFVGLTRIIALLTLSLLLFSGPAMAQEGTTWADRLGYPPGEKVVLLHGYGAGISHETNAAVVELLNSGALTCASALPPAPWFAHLASNAPDELGLALTINSDLPHYRWGPLESESNTRSLVDDQGYFWSRTQQSMVSADPVDVEYEIRAQIQRSKELGLKPSHMTTHLGTLYARPDLTEVYLRIAREHWIPAVVVALTQEQLDRFRSEGFPLPDSLIRLMAEYPLPKLDDLRGCPPADSYEEKKKVFLELINGMRPGITQFALSPAYDSPALRVLTDDWQQRVWEAQLLTDNDVRAALSADDVRLADWTELMARFEGRAVEVTEDAE